MVTQVKGDFYFLLNQIKRGLILSLKDVFIVTWLISEILDIIKAATLSY